MICSVYKADAGLAVVHMLVFKHSFGAWWGGGYACIKIPDMSFRDDIKAF